jgi:hypothetical protein
MARAFQFDVDTVVEQLNRICRWNLLQSSTTRITPL